MRFALAQVFALRRRKFSAIGAEAAIADAGRERGDGNRWAGSAKSSGGEKRGAQNAGDKWRGQGGSRRIEGRRKIGDGWRCAGIFGAGSVRGESAGAGNARAMTRGGRSGAKCAERKD